MYGSGVSIMWHNKYHKTGFKLKNSNGGMTLVNILMRTHIMPVSVGMEIS